MRHARPCAGTALPIGNRRRGERRRGAPGRAGSVARVVIDVAPVELGCSRWTAVSPRGEGRGDRRVQSVVERAGRSVRCRFVVESLLRSVPSMSRPGERSPDASRRTRASTWVRRWAGGLQSCLRPSRKLYPDFTLWRYVNPGCHPIGSRRPKIAPGRSDGKSFVRCSIPCMGETDRAPRPSRYYFGHACRRTGVAPLGRRPAAPRGTSSTTRSGAPTLEDVARVAGVSRATVSRVSTENAGLRQISRKWSAGPC